MSIQTPEEIATEILTRRAAVLDAFPNAEVEAIAWNLIEAAMWRTGNAYAECLTRISTIIAAVPLAKAQLEV